MKNILIISKKLKTLNKKLYIVGGFCREKILGGKNEGGDIDLVTDATPDEMQKVLRIVGEVGKKYGTCIVLEGNQDFEITTFRKDIGTINNRKPAEVIFTDSLEEDSKRRDLTCNAIYFDVEKEIFIDPTGGIEDIKNNIIRFVGKAEERINEDALRILRFIRFKNKYGFKNPVGTHCNVSLQKKLKNNSHLLKNISVDRIRQELDKILLLKNNIQALEDLKEIDFFKHIIPEIKDFSFLKKIVQLNLNSIEKQDKLIIYYTIIFNDNVGFDIFSSEIANRLKFTNNQKKEITWLIKNYIKLFLIPEIRPEGSALGVGILESRKLMIHPLFEKLLIIGEGDNEDRITVKYDEINNIKNIYKDFKKIIKTKIFLTGEDVMRKYPELKGRKIGEKLEMLNDQIMVKD